ncbi:hypothetical protein OG713_02670 [Streptomyces sp. NBC_00723]|uniref:hypothetical protein n=1 Tax=Streptomyces sp. NBC_00723 TaxID=2903673 RepID=UPI00386FFEAB
MHTRTTIAVITAALAFTLAGCSSDKADSAKSSTPAATAATAATAGADISAAEKAAGIPPEPDSAQRAVLLAGLQAIDPWLVGDEDEAIDNARNQCSTISGGGNADATAKSRFSTPAHEVTDDEAKAINRVLKVALCLG